MIKENHNAALKLINEIAVIDSDFAAKIKPSIDTFVESLEVALEDNDNYFEQLSKYLSLSTKEEKIKFLEEHPDLVDKIQELKTTLSDSNKKSSVALNEDVEIVKDIPITSKETKAEEDKEDKIPEDSFKDEKIEVPVPVKDDNKKFFGKTQKEVASKKELNPNKTPKVEDLTPNDEVKVPNLKNDKGQIELESRMNKIFKRHILESKMNKIFKRHI